MTEAEAIKQLEEIQVGDTEAAHMAADIILLEFTREHHPNLAQAWDAIEVRCGGFWYA